MNTPIAYAAKSVPSGTIGSRPAPSAALVGTWYYASDRDDLYFCRDASTWVLMGPPGQELPLTANTQLYYLLSESATPSANGGAFGTADMAWSGGQAANGDSVFGNVLRFGGTTNEQLKASALASFEPTSFAVGCWIKLFGYTDGSPIVHKRWQQSSFADPFFSLGFQLRDTTVDGQWAIFGADQSGPTFRRAYALAQDGPSLNSWHYMGVAYNASTKVLHGYLNGLDKIQQSFTTGIAYASTSKGYWEIGGLDNGSMHGLNGLVTRVRVEDVFRDATWYREQYLRGIGRWNGS